MELPAKVVWTIKPDKLKHRIAACGNQTKDSYRRTSTTDLETAMLRFMLSWAASSSVNKVASLDITAAFLNAAFATSRGSCAEASFNPSPCESDSSRFLLESAYGHVWFERGS